MIIIPAIDVRNGRCIRLQQGRFDQVTMYPDAPQARAAHYAALGASRLHVVDLDGARLGEMQQLSLIQSIQSTVKSTTIQVGGGIRSINTARACALAGISVLVIGSLAITDRTLAVELINEVQAKNIVLAIDVNCNDGIPNPAVHGWQTTTQYNAWDIVKFYKDAGIRTILCTDIAQDGMMTGPNFTLYEEAVRRFPTISWQASGGIRHSSDIKTLAACGVSAVILGRVLYDSDFNFLECVQECASC